MTTERIKAIQREIGVEPDGFWGPISRTAARTFLRKMCPNNPWPESNTTALRKFYGDFGEAESREREKFLKNNLTTIDVRGLEVEYDGRPVNSITCHKYVADSLFRVLTEISKSPSSWVLKGYAGCFNIRKMKLGDAPSKHSWAVAIDLGVKGNGLKTPWPQVATMPWEVIKIFAREGWRSGGVLWGIDAQHFEAVKV
ncbi:MAG: M15 family metallopeptidase [Chitinophagales bacterium]|nr:M15 family metallopeptidase [Chitinophagales bacterium]